MWCVKNHDVMLYNVYMCIMAMRVVEFSNGGTKLEFFLHMNQRTLVSLITVEVGINVEGVQKLQNQ